MVVRANLIHVNQWIGEIWRTHYRLGWAPYEHDLMIATDSSPQPTQKVISIRWHFDILHRIPWFVVASIRKLFFVVNETVLPKCEPEWKNNIGPQAQNVQKLPKTKVYLPYFSLFQKLWNTFFVNIHSSTWCLIELTTTWVLLSTFSNMQLGISFLYFQISHKIVRASNKPRPFPS